MRTFLLCIYMLGLAALLQSCDAAGDVGAVSADAAGGKGGSMARFAIVGDYLYTVNHEELSTYDITNSASPELVSMNPVGFGIETIFPRQNYLFIGSQDGMYIYDASRPEYPQYVSKFEHVVSCDPVVADDRFAYVTLRAESGRCWRGVNQLDIISIEDMQVPQLLRSYDMTNPKGLGVAGNELFVCDDVLKLYDITNRNDIKLKNIFNIPANDVIPYQGRLLVTANDGFYQYSFDGENVELLSKLNILRTDPEQ
ncbi:hypothetical protein V6R21_31720 [Limibacter armeniacum]|uniref:LVIVD repeat-containing protein n=1 Tax=Limibacter armeniacum TaxID=466084 RepID=UPI002FE642B1